MMARLSGLLLLVVVVALSPQQQASGLMDPDILRRVSEAVRLRGVVLLSGGGGGDGSGVGAEISLSSRRLLRSSSSLGGGTTVKILPVDVAAELDLRLEEREESLVLDTSGVPVDLLGRILRTNLDSLGVRAPAVIVFNSERDFDNSGTAPILPDFAINQQVYFLALEEGSISERYSVGGVTVAADLWTFDAASGRFVRVSKQADGDFLSRRSDFRGATLTGLVEKQAPYLILSGPGGEGSEVKRTVTEGGTEMEVIHPEQMEGMFRDLQIVMERELNFSCVYLRREDRQWGNGLGNGTFTGMVDDVHRGHVDFIATSLTMKPSRAEGITYLHPIGTETYALFVPTSGREEFAWTVFLQPFSTEVWMALAINAAILAVVIRLFYLHHLWWSAGGGGTARLPSCVSQTVDYVSLCWSLLCSYLGKPPPPYLSGTGLGSPVRMAVFLAFFGGLVVWCAYRASLTSELVNQVVKKPFDSLQTFLESEYQLIAKTGGASEQVLRTSPEGTIFNQIFVKNLQSKEQEREFFLPTEEEGLAKLWESEVKTAYFYVMETVITYEDYKCKVFAPWISPFPSFLSMATSHRSPYLPFMRRFVLTHVEKGTLALLSARWKRGIPDCSPEGAQALGSEKTVSVFSIWAAGAAGGVALLLAEVAAVGYRKKVGRHRRNNSGQTDFGSKPEKTDTKFGWKTTTTKASNLDNDGIAARMRALAKQVQEDPSVDKRLFVSGLEDLVRVLKSANGKATYS